MQRRDWKRATRRAKWKWRGRRLAVIQSRHVWNRITSTQSHFHANRYGKLIFIRTPMCSSPGKIWEGWKTRGRKGQAYEGRSIRVLIQPQTWQFPISPHQTKQAPPPRQMSSPPLQNWIYISRSGTILRDTRRAAVGAAVAGDSARWVRR